MLALRHLQYIYALFHRVNETSWKLISSRAGSVISGEALAELELMAF